MQGLPRQHQSRRLRGQHTHGHAVRYLDSKPSAHRAGANDSKSLFPVRHGQNVWGIALGRKNYLFCGSDAGGQAAAAIYSLIGTARLNGIDPERYLQHVPESIADLPITRIHEMLPWNFATPQTDLA
jgi:hypothetical protein